MREPPRVPRRLLLLTMREPPHPARTRGAVTADPHFLRAHAASEASLMRSSTPFLTRSSYLARRCHAPLSSGAAAVEAHRQPSLGGPAPKLGSQWHPRSRSFSTSYSAEFLISSLLLR
ncbi:hypothetical protein VPH35_064724 [Triticum aestivum]